MSTQMLVRRQCTSMRSAGGGGDYCPVSKNGGAQGWRAPTANKPSKCRAFLACYGLRGTTRYCSGSTNPSALPSVSHRLNLSMRHQRAKG